MVIGLDWVTTIFQIPFLIPLFGLLTLSVVIGFKSAIRVSLIGAIPSYLQTIIDSVALSSSKNAAVKGIELSQNCNGNFRCFTGSLHNPSIDWFMQFFPSAPQVSLSPVFAVLGFTIEMTFGIAFIYLMVRSIIKFRKDIKQRLGSKYRFKR